MSGMQHMEIVHCKGTGRGKDWGSVLRCFNKTGLVFDLKSSSEICAKSRSFYLLNGDWALPDFTVPTLPRNKAAQLFIYGVLQPYILNWQCTVYDAYIYIYNTTATGYSATALPVALFPSLPSCLRLRVVKFLLFFHGPESWWFVIESSSRKVMSYRTHSPEQSCQGRHFFRDINERGKGARHCYVCETDHDVLWQGLWRSQWCCKCQV